MLRNDIRLETCDKGDLKIMFILIYGAVTVGCLLKAFELSSGEEQLPKSLLPCNDLRHDPSFCYMRNDAALLSVLNVTITMAELDFAWRYVAVIFKANIHGRGTFDFEAMAHDQRGRRVHTWLPYYTTGDLTSVLIDGAEAYWNCDVSVGSRVTSWLSMRFGRQALRCDGSSDSGQFLLFAHHLGVSRDSFTVNAVLALKTVNDTTPVSQTTNFDAQFSDQKFIVHHGSVAYGYTSLVFTGLNIAAALAMPIVYGVHMGKYKWREYLFEQLWMWFIVTENLFYSGAIQTVAKIFAPAGGRLWADILANPMDLVWTRV